MLHHAKRGGVNTRGYKMRISTSTRPESFHRPSGKFYKSTRSSGLGYPPYCSGHSSQQTRGLKRMTWPSRPFFRSKPCSRCVPPFRFAGLCHGGMNRGTGDRVHQFWRTERGAFHNPFCYFCNIEGGGRGGSKPVQGVTM